MDFSTSFATHMLEDSADKKRLDSFRLGGPAPSNAHHARKFSHSRSHSRNTSVSGPSLSLSLAAPSSLPGPDSPPSSPPSLPAGNPKRNSHHRRRSSVSTRRESAEIMGVSMITPAPSVEDNINLGDKDSIRRRALLTLEGKTDVGAFSKVEIPELGTPELERRFDFPSKPSFPPGIGAGFGGSLSSLGSSKRDSFGKFRASTSSKEQLGTLVEEDEEAEEERGPLSSESDDGKMEQVSSPVEMVVSQPASAPARHRPATLNLRPLSLAAASQGVVSDLPTPEPSPGYRPRPGLKALTLSPSLSTENAHTAKDAPTIQTERRLMTVPLSSSSAFVPARRQSLTAAKENAPPRVSRRSSISYVSSQESSASFASGLPTPEMTPTSERRYSVSSDSSASSLGSRSSRSLSNSEHHFLYQAHAALVQRISDLERALSARPQSRPQSYSSEASLPSEPPTDEMLQLVADLKAERDELKKDVDGWRTRVSDGQNQVSLLMKRVEVERREAWVARERAGLIEIEKKSIERMLAEKEQWAKEGWAKYEAAEAELVTALEESQQLREKLTRHEELQAECTKLAAALIEERKKREEVERELDSLLTTPTPQTADSKYHTPPVSRTMVFAKRGGGLGFRSIDSADSYTDVESLSDPIERPQFSLKSVVEEDEGADYSQDLSQSDSSDVDDLAGYEDADEDDDYDLQASMSTSSFGSDDYPRETSHLLEAAAVSGVPELTSSRSASSSPAPVSPPQSHGRRASLSKAWTFPQPTESVSFAPRETEEIDRFFGCLEDVDNSPPIDSRLRSSESSKNLFSQALADADDDLPPFYIPVAIGVEVPAEEPKFALHVVAEEDEEVESEGDYSKDDDASEIVGQVVDGGIIFTFTPPPDFDVPEDVPVPRPVTQSETQPSSPDNGRSPFSTRSSPSSIPRRASKGATSSIPTASSPPPRTSAVAFPKPSGSPAAFSTPTKLTGPPSSSASKRTQAASFIPQPRRNVPQSSSRPAYSTPTKSQSKPRPILSPEVRSTQPPALLKNEMTIHARLDSPSSIHDVPASPAMSPTLAALQTLTSFMPSLPWSSPKLGFGTPSSVASCIIPSSSSGHGVSDSVDCANKPSNARGRTFVSRESQLAKLRLRLHQEHLQHQAQPRQFVARDYQDGVLDI